MRNRAKFVRQADEIGAFPGDTVALVPAGGEVWEDFLDTIGVSLEQFCSQGPGGWMLGYIDALACAGVRIVLVLFSAEVDGVQRYVHPASRAVIAVLPVSRAYMRSRARFPSYRPTLLRQLPIGLAASLRTGIGAGLSHLSTPWRLLLRELRRHDCRAIICQEYEYFRFDACVAAGRLLAIPVFATFQGASRDPNVLSRIWKAPVVRSADSVIIPVRGEALRVRARYGDRVRIAPIFNPVDIREWNGGDRLQCRENLGLGRDARVVVWHGRISIHTKGLDILAAAWRKVRQARSGQDLRLMMMGAGEDADAFARLLAEGPDCGISWHKGYVTDRAEIRRFLAAGDIYAFPSRMEGFPVAPIEAMACGLPVVAADASGVREIIGTDARVGEIVPAGDSDAFADALGKLLDDPVRIEAMGRAARHRAETTFSLEAVGHQLANLLRAGGRQPAPRQEAS